MCGIAGIYHAGAKAETGWLKRMTDAIRHRGSDDEGFLAVDGSGEIFPLTGSESHIQGNRIESFGQDSRILLGHRRLSIIDLSPLGHQPMANDDQSLWIVYNGEIYNYIELREELKTLGFRFHTGTDTEVVLAAYQSWGEKCLDRFNGMWAFVLYDQKRNRLFGARDRFGVKPFYYYRHEDIFAFASEIKALLTLPFIPKEINPKAVFDYLVFNWQETEEEGFFKNIFELPPSYAFYYDFSENDFRKWRYYTLLYTDRWVSFEQKQLEFYLERAKGLLADAVELRLQSDVPVGSCLSGGMDSSTIVCFINRLLEQKKMTQVGERQKVFTASYENEQMDESRWAKIVVDHTKTSWYQTYPKSRDLFKDIEDMVYTQDIPFGSTSIYAQYRVMRLARDNGVKVLLDGQGGDELFTGYTGYYRPYFAEMLKHLDVKSLVREFRGLSNSPVNAKFIIGSLLKLYGSRLIPAGMKPSVVRKLYPELQYLNPEFWDEYQKRVQLLNERAITSLNQTLFEFISGMNLKTLLRYEDRNSMRFSIESRTPFADDINLIEYIFQIPSVYKIHDGWSKSLLRQMTPGIVPDEIRFRKDKLGFSTPEYRWLNELKGDLKDMIGDEIDSFIDVQRLRRDWDDVMVNQASQGITWLWKFINLALWSRIYSVR